MNHSIIEIANIIGADIIGDKKLTVNSIAPIAEALEEDITFVTEEKYIHFIAKTKSKVIIINNSDNLVDGKTYLLVKKKNIRQQLPILISYFKPKIKNFEKIIEKSSLIGTNCQIFPNSYIGHDVCIGNNCIIYPNVTIMEGTKIGDNCMIYSNVTVREYSKIGKNCIFQPGVVIGSDGFGYVKIGTKNIKIDQIGKVIIEDDVEIGSNSTIDRGTIGNTLIKKGTKLDNLVHIAHNDIIGSDCLIVAQTGIAGSTVIGNNVTIGGQVGISGHLKIGDNNLIGAKSGVTGNLKSNLKVSGFPVKSHREELKLKILYSKLPLLLERIKKLENLVEEN